MQSFVYKFLVMNVLQPFFELFPISIFFVASPTEQHKVFDNVLSLSSSHLSAVYVVDVDTARSADFARHKLAAVIAERFKVGQGMFFHN